MAATEQDYLGKTGCYDTCEIGHQCFGGYLNYDHACDEEFRRMANLMRSVHTGENVTFNAMNGRGVFFIKGDYEYAVRNEAGYWVKREWPLAYLSR